MIEVACDFLPTYVHYMRDFFFNIALHRTFICTTLHLQRPPISATFHIFKVALSLLSMCVTLGFTWIIVLNIVVCSFMHYDYICGEKRGF